MSVSRNMDSAVRPRISAKPAAKATMDLVERLIDLHAQAALLAAVDALATMKAGLTIRVLGYAIRDHQMILRRSA
jgi:hypothetical protein